MHSLQQQTSVSTRVRIVVFVVPIVVETATVIVAIRIGRAGEHWGEPPGVD